MADRDPGTVVIESLVKEFHERRKEVMSKERPVASRRRIAPTEVGKWMDANGYRKSRFKNA